LTLATVLLNSLMARSQFNAVPWLLTVAGAYGVTLWFCHKCFTQVIQILGIFSTIMLAVCARYAFFDSSPSNAVKRNNPSNGSASAP